MKVWDKLNGWTSSQRETLPRFGSVVKVWDKCESMGQATMGKVFFKLRLPSSACLCVCLCVKEMNSCPLKNESLYFSV